MGLPKEIFPERGAREKEGRKWSPNEAGHGFPFEKKEANIRRRSSNRGDLKVDPLKDEGTSTLPARGFLFEIP